MRTDLGIPSITVSGIMLELKVPDDAAFIPGHDRQAIQLDGAARRERSADDDRSRLANAGGLAATMVARPLYATAGGIASDAAKRNAMQIAAAAEASAARRLSKALLFIVTTTRLRSAWSRSSKREMRRTVRAPAWYQSAAATSELTIAAMSRTMNRVGMSGGLV